MSYTEQELKENGTSGSFSTEGQDNALNDI
jgi:hypothetical protein